MADDKPGPEQPSTNFTDDELEEKLSAFDNRVKAASKKVMPDVPEWNYQRKAPPLEAKASGSKSSVTGLAFGLTMLYTLVGPILVGYGIGFLIDRRNHGSGAATTGTVVGMVLGFCAMVFLVSHQMKRDEKK